MSQIRTPPRLALGAIRLHSLGPSVRIGAVRALQVLWYASILALSYLVLEAHITESFLYEGF